MSKTPAPTAKEINEAHQFAKECVETAVEHAVRCGQLLAKKKDALKHGEFESWVEQWCDFKPRAARKYMQIASEAKGQNGIAVPFSSMQKALGYESKPKDKPNSPKGADPVLNPKGTGETGTDRPAAPHAAPPAAAPSPPPSEGEPERPDDHDEDAAIQAAEAELAASIDKVMQADDRLAAAYAEIKRQAAEIATLKISRDGYMRGKEAVTKLLKAAQKRIEQLEKKFKAAA